MYIRRVVDMHVMDETFYALCEQRVATAWPLAGKEQKYKKPTELLH